MNRNATFAILLLVIFGLACGSINRATPAGVDDAAMKADVKGKIAAVDPGKTFDIGVTVDAGVVTLTGTVDTEAERQKIADAANSVSGVKSVINNITTRR